MPISYALENGNNILLMADGISPILRWDGFSSQAEPAGVAPPLTALSMTVSGIGNIVGTYFAYSRFVDKFGNVSNLSPVSAALDAKGGRTIQITGASNSPSALISAATNATPINCTSAAHGRATGQVLKITGGLGNTNINGTWAITVTGVNNFTLNGSAGNGVYVANSATWKLQIPITITTAVPHNIQVGAAVVISGVTGNTDANGTWLVLAVPTATTFTINQFSGGNANYTGGGTILTGQFGLITNATPATPIVITSNGHGLSTGLVVKVTGVQGNVDANGTWTITVIDANTFSLNGSSGIFSFSPSPQAIWTSGALTINYTGFPVPTESKVVRRQILRNTDGQAIVFYVDVDTTSLLTTTASSTRGDDELSAQEAVAFFDSAGNPIANLHTVPPNWKSCLVAHQDRMFYLGEVAYSEGNVIVTNGSPTITGIATEWVPSLSGRVIYVDGAPKSYEILSVVGQVITLTENYMGPTSNYSFYSIRPATSERRLVYFSEPGAAESVPSTNALALEEDNDDLTGGMSYRSFVYLFERKHIYRLSFQQDPSKDGAVYLATQRGCVNDRCWEIAEDGVYMLDEEGVHVFDGGEGGASVSDQIQSFFRQDPTSLYHINWTSQRFFHSIHFKAQGIIRWFVALAGDYLPRHALVYAYKVKKWWLEEFKVPVGCSKLGRTGPANAGWQIGVEQMYLGSEAKRILGYWSGQLDGLTGGTGRGIATSGGWISLSDNQALFTSDSVGMPVTITSGRGKGQTRVISSVTATKLIFTWPWATVPDETSTYQIGGVPWVWRGGSHQLTPSEADQQRGFEITFSPTSADQMMDMRRFVDMETDPENSGVTFTDQQQMGVATTKDDPDMVIDLRKEIGYVKKTFTGRREESMDGIRRVKLEIRGVSGPEPVTVFRIGIEGAQQ